MKKILLGMAGMLIGYTGFAQNTDKMVSSYIAIKNALVDGNSKAVGGAITTFRSTVNAEPAFTQQKELLKAADKLAEANNLDKQRESFNDVSTIFWNVVKNADNGSKPLYYQYCPMKKGYWLSYEKEIRNPYYGSAMLACGKVVETKL